MSLYTDDDVNVVYQFAWDVHESGGKGHLSFSAAEAVLDRVAPAIAARALREVAEVIEPSTTTGRYPEESAILHEREIIAESLRDRADEIEAQP